MSQTKAQLIDNLVQPLTGTLGTASAPAYSFTADPNTGVYSPGADQLAISTGGTGRLFVDANGAIGINTSTTSTQQMAVVGPSTNPILTLFENTSGNTGRLRVYVSDTDGVTFNATNTNLAVKPIVFSQGASTERLRIDSSGRLLLGTSTNAASKQLIFQNAAEDSLTIRVQSGSYGFGWINLDRQLAGGSAVGIDAGLGVINFRGWDGSNPVIGASIFAVVDATSGANNMPGRLVFLTTANGASSPTERLRITSDGTLRLFNSPGIDFSQIQTNAAGMTSETLDSYEEGTWTPTVIGTTTAGTASYITQIGKYTKIGNTVTVQVYINYNSGTGAGSLRISGLPFTPANVAGQIYFSGGSVSNILLTANNTAYFTINPNITAIAIDQSPVGGGAASNVTYDVAGSIGVTMSYFTA